jgi:hypothetical protein
MNEAAIVLDRAPARMSRSCREPAEKLKGKLCLKCYQSERRRRARARRIPGKLARHGHDDPPPGYSGIKPCDVEMWT